MKENNQRTQASLLPGPILRNSTLTSPWLQKFANKLGKNTGQRVSLLLLFAALTMVVFSIFLDGGNSGSAQYRISWYDIAAYSLFLLSLIVRIAYR